MISHDGLRALLEHSVPQASMQVQQVCDTNVPAIAVAAWKSPPCMTLPCLNYLFLMSNNFIFVKAPNLVYCRSYSGSSIPLLSITLQESRLEAYRIDLESDMAQLTSVGKTAGTSSTSTTAVVPVVGARGGAAQLPVSAAMARAMMHNFNAARPNAALEDATAWSLVSLASTEANLHHILEQFGHEPFYEHVRRLLAFAEVQDTDKSVDSASITAPVDSSNKAGAAGTPAQAPKASPSASEAARLSSPTDALAALSDNTAVPLNGSVVAGAVWTYASVLQESDRLKVQYNQC